LLASRFVLGGGFIEAWNGRGAENITIIDTLMNLPLLYWASREISNDRYKRIAMAHADAAIKTHLRPDGSVAHIVEHDRESGEVIRTFGGQGYAEGSAWSRGSAWAIYGFTLSYIHTGEERYLKAAISAADYFISGISQDGTVPVDFKAPLEPKIIDTSAAACAACGMIELGKILKAPGGKAYTDAAIRLLSVIDSKYANYETGVDYLLSCGTVNYPTDGDFEKAEVHVPIIYADYFYTEAILKLCGSEFNPW
jgi:unsaturated chondroitin disaccharide hydrolase